MKHEYHFFIWVYLVNSEQLRKDGFKKDAQSLLTEHKEVVKLLKQGYSARKTMKLTDKSSGTVQKIKKLLEQ
ncbi:hypothetical protein [Flavobacterium sp. 1]|uniref:hypothetical protein n=1 Tax=Flavobacterium sp. 1 TaxID=2035200 RepID=UPI000C231C92|nr:hypothetical protein [Flavobacterium sp. 1]